MELEETWVYDDLCKKYATNSLFYVAINKILNRIHRAVPRTNKSIQNRQARVNQE